MVTDVIDVPVGDIGRHLGRLAISSGMGMVVAVDGTIAWANPAARSLLGADEASLVGDSLDRLGLVEALDRSSDAHPPTVAELLEGPPVAATYRVHRFDGREIVLRLETAHPGGDAAGVAYLTLQGAGREVDDQRRLAVSQARFGALATHAPMAVCVSDIGMRIAFANDRMAATWGREAEELLGTGWLESVVERDTTRIRHTIAQVLQHQEATVSVSIERPDGEERMLVCRFAPVEREDRSVGFVATAEDVTELHRQQSQLEWQATHDPLTGLANREALREHCAGLIDAGVPFALLFLDLDDFKLVNDGLGHSAGDELLCTVARRILDATTEDDLVCRIGGDEFVVVAGAVVSDGAACAAGEAVLEAVSHPATIEGQPVQITASLGVIVSDDDAVDVESLMRDADIAMYQAKRAGKGRVATFQDGARDAIYTHLALLGHLRDAVSRQEITLAYQPIVETTHGRTVSVEALLRYEHPELGNVSPLDVISLAEETGLYRDLGAAVLAVAARQMRLWVDELGDFAPDHVSVNVSAAQLMESDFPAEVAGILEANTLPAGRLMIEVTESHAMRDIETAVHALQELSELGVGVAIDDFGTGHSSLAYLARLPFDVVKVDRAFVRDLAHNPTAVAIITALVALATALEAQVVVEGVEDEAQYDIVTGLGCELVQGYLLARPAPPGQVPWVVDLPFELGNGKAAS